MNSQTPAPSIPLENNTCEVIGKSMRCQMISIDSLSEKSKLTREAIAQALDESAPRLDNASLERIAAALNLSPSALIGLADYTPRANAPQELIQIVSPFYEAGVNSFLIKHKDGSSATLFDTGTDPNLIQAGLKKNQLKLTSIFITHEHHDHITGLAELARSTAASIHLPSQISHGEVHSLSENIQLTAVNSSGHCTPSFAYLIDGLSVPLCICGDIIFAGSMGKSPSPEQYQKSIDNAQNHIMCLELNTIICPGHGPLTTVGQEAQNNPFLAVKK